MWRVATTLLPFLSSSLTPFLPASFFHFLSLSPPSPLSVEFAMSPNNNEVHIYAKKSGKWEVEHVLKEVNG